MKRRFVYRLFLALVILTFFACAPAVQSGLIDPQKGQIEKLSKDNGILERALKRCEARLPSNSWPNMITVGSFGDGWITAESHGKEFPLHPHYGDHEEQLFIVVRSHRDEKITFEGEGVRMIDSGTIYAILAYVPPQSDEERKKLQKVIIALDDYRFVILFKPTRF